LEVKVNAPKPWLREIEVEIEPERLKAKSAELLSTYGERAQVPGFRRGHAPKYIVERRLGPAVESSAAEDIVEETMAEVLKAQTFRPATQVRLADLEVTKDKAIRYRLSVEVIPDIELKEYKGLKLKKEEPTGFDAEFERRLKALQEKCSTLRPVARPAGEKDVVVVDYETFSADQPVGKPRKNLLLEVGDQMNFKEVNAVLSGARPGEQRSALVDFPADHPDKEFAGKPVTFKFSVRDVKEKVVPEVDEDLATALGYENLDALRKELNESILADRARLVENGLKNQAFDFLVREHDFEPPQSWVEAALERLLREYELPDDKETRERLLPAAVKRAKFDCLAGLIADKENVTVTEEEVKAKVEALAANVKRPAEEVAPLLDNPSYRNQLLREKVLSLILEHAQLT